jgi:hypothetical protein
MQILSTDGKNLFTISCFESFLAKNNNKDDWMPLRPIKQL